MKKGALSVGFLFDDTLDSNDGVAQQVKILGGWLARQGHEVNYFVGQSKIRQWQGGEVHSLSRNLTVNFNGNRLTTPLLADKALMRQLLGRHRLDIVHLQAPYSPLMAARFLRLLQPATAVIGTFHIMPNDRWVRMGSRLLGWWLWRSRQRVNTFTAVSSSAAGFAKTYFNFDCVVIPNMIDAGRLEARTVNSERPRIVYLGRLVKRKGVEQLVDAVGYLANDRRYKNFELVIAGDGPERSKLQSKVHKLGLAGHTRFLGYVPENAKAKLLASADIACFPSLAGESFGLVLVEAMAAGSKLILAGDNPGYRSVLGGQPKLLVDPADRRQFGDRLHELLSNQSGQPELTRWLRQQAGQYDVNVVGPRFVRLYRQAIAKQSAKQ